jgi:hypothetical protein
MLITVRKIPGDERMQRPFGEIEQPIDSFPKREIRLLFALFFE